MKSFLSLLEEIEVFLIEKGQPVRVILKMRVGYVTSSSWQTLLGTSVTQTATCKGNSNLQVKYTTMYRPYEWNLSLTHPQNISTVVVGMSDIVNSSSNYLHTHLCVDFDFDIYRGLLTFINLSAVWYEVDEPTLQLQPIDLQWGNELSSRFKSTDLPQFQRCLAKHKYPICGRKQLFVQACSEAAPTLVNKLSNRSS
jgi:hypothetical protein